MFVEYLQNLSAISMGSVNVFPSDLNDVGREDHVKIQSLPDFQAPLPCSFLKLLQTQREVSSFCRSFKKCVIEQ